MKKVTVIGAGLAGCEAAWQLARRGVLVTLVEMRPQRMPPAHHGGMFAELVCSNSLRSDDVTNAVGLLKQEMRMLDSIIMRAADSTRVPAGKALAVDREGFSKTVTELIHEHPNVTVVHECVERIPEGPCIVATGPLTAGALAQDIERISGAALSFFDAAAPIVTLSSLNLDRMFKASRYGGDNGADYWNCPMDEEQYRAFWEALSTAEQQPLHEFEDSKVFEGCMPIEVMARRGYQTMAHGPMKPVGLPDPRTGQEAHAVVQLRQDDWAGELYNLVGFQTHLKFPEQQRVFRMIPGLEQAEFVRYGVMHRNTFLRSPGFLDHTYRCITRPDLFFAGQMTGVEGYVESAASGLLAGLRMAYDLDGRELPDFTMRTAVGALGYYVANAPIKHFQPMNINYGIMESLGQKVRGKRMRNQMYSERALETIMKISII